MNSMDGQQSFAAEFVPGDVPHPTRVELEAAFGEFDVEALGGGRRRPRFKAGSELSGRVN